MRRDQTRSMRVRNRPEFQSCLPRPLCSSTLDHQSICLTPGRNASRPPSSTLSPLRLHFLDSLNGSKAPQYSLSGPRSASPDLQHSVSSLRWPAGRALLSISCPGVVRSSGPCGMEISMQCSIHTEVTYCRPCLKPNGSCVE